MTTSLSAYLAQSSIPVIDGVHYLSEPDSLAELEQRYLTVRKREGRLYSDDLVRQLPQVPADHPHRNEWRIRAHSAWKLRLYLDLVARGGQMPSPLTILDLGCGNGWLAHRLAKKLPDSLVYGLDVNRPELTQAVRLFGHRPNLTFLYGNILADILPAGPFHIIVMGSVSQYFANLPGLLTKLLTLLSSAGQIHVFDTPIYQPGEVAKARQATQRYYQKLGCPEMTVHYHHHSWADLSRFEPMVMHRPAAFFTRLRRKLLGRPESPFPWLMIRRPADF